MLYLDTSAVRAIGKAIAGSRQADLVTSALTIVELVTGACANEDEFRRIRPGLDAIMSSGSPVSVDWRLPDDPLTVSFNWMNDNCSLKEPRIEPLKSIADLLVSSGSLTEFRQREMAAELSVSLEYWREFDVLFGKTYVETSRVTGVEVKTAFDRAKLGEGNVEFLGSAIQKMSYREFCRWFAREHAAINRAATIRALAQNLAVQVKPSDPSDDLVAAICGSYNHSIDVFVDAFSWRAMMDHSDGRTPGRNDALDLAHFLYLKPGAGLSTGDNTMCETARAVELKVTPPTDLRAAAAKSADLSRP